MKSGKLGIASNNPGFYFGKSFFYTGNAPTFPVFYDAQEELFKVMFAGIAGYYFSFSI
ncbi:MAG: hypothetical protein ABJB11_11610 [Ferruginibacter sp.]